MSVPEQPALLPPEPRQEVAPGAVLLAGWLDAAAQAELVAQFHDWARPPAGLRRARMPNGSSMSVATVCLGWHWYPYTYSRTVDDGDGSPVKPFPGRLATLARDALAAAAFDPAGYEPDAALVNHYDPGARMGMHADRDEAVDAPVVSISLGDDGRFRFGNPRTRTRPFTDLVLRSGDVFVFGGPARYAYHGVLGTRPGTGPPSLGLAGRVNITVRQTGLH